jgi:threonylcarbamoyladenosine tRNA methylthiotransferase MtaB
MNLAQLREIITKTSAHTYQAINFGCRANSSEVNQLSQIFIDFGLSPEEDNPDIFLVNTCAITKKGEYESLYKIKKLAKDFPDSTIIATGCATLSKVNNLKNVITFDNLSKENILKSVRGSYNHQIKDKFSNTQRYVLRVQSGCSVNCTFCIVPTRRPYLESLSIDDAANSVNQAVADGYQEVIITGVNLGQYFPGFSNLIEALLTRTKINLISFGSVPVLCIDDKFLSLFTNYGLRITNFLHIPLQSCSDKILGLMHRPYNQKMIIDKIKNCKLKIKNLSLGTDIIVGFPGETEGDFQETFDLCQSIGFSKIHTFTYSPRPDTVAREIFLKSPKISKAELSRRSRLIRSLSLTSVL